MMTKNRDDVAGAEYQPIRRVRKHAREVYEQQHCRCVSCGRATQNGVNVCDVCR